MTEHVYLLWHTHEPNEEENGKLLGVYSSRERAEQRILQANELPGFRDWPDGYIIDDYGVDDDKWREGFVTTYD